MQNILLETERLILRKPEESDFKDLKEGLDNINIAKNIASMPNPYSLEMVKNYFTKQINKWDEKNPKDLLFVIELKSEEKAIGAFGVHNINKELNEAQTGCWLNESYQRNGYMTEAKIAGNTFAFNQLGLEKLISPIFEKNIPSKKVQEKLGYEFIKYEKEPTKCLATGKFHKTKIYELTKEKWNIVLSNLLDNIER